MILDYILALLVPPKGVLAPGMLIYEVRKKPVESFRNRRGELMVCHPTKGWRRAR